MGALQAKATRLAGQSMANSSSVRLMKGSMTLGEGLLAGLVVSPLTSSSGVRIHPGPGCAWVDGLTTWSD
jgi:hypothetical protein